MYYHYYRRRTLAKVPHHFSFFYFFLANRSFAIFTNIDTRASLAMASLPPPTAGRRPFRCNALVSHIMGNSPPPRFDQIHRGGGDLHNNSPGQFEGVFAATTWGNRHCLYRHPRPFYACSGATRLLPAPWATPHPLGLIKFVKGGETRSGATRLLPTPWATPHPLGSF